jgi:hypothetical protein
MASGKRRTDLRWQTAFIFATLIPLAVITGVCAAGEPGTALVAFEAAGRSQPQLVTLPPGVLIADKPPTGWSHIVVKSVPRLASGDRGTLPAGSSKTATLFRTAILADVKPLDFDEKEFELARVGVAICVPRDEDHDMVVSADRVQALGLKLTAVQRVVLDAAEAELAEGRIIARTPTFALFRSPATVVLSTNEHRKLNLCYAFCVERTTGKLNVGVWTMPLETKSQRAPSALVRLGSDPIFDCQIDVRAKRILGTVPYSWSFAMRSLPPGRPLRIPPALGELIALTNHRPDESDTEELERQLLLTLSSTTDNGIRRTAIPPPYSGAK